MGKYWTQFGPQAYTKVINKGTAQEEVIGLGALKLWGFPGAWNIFAMSFPELPEVLNYGSDPAKYPRYTGLVPLAVGTALQMTPEGRLIGQIAEESSPKEFLKAIADFPYLILPRMYPEVWLEVAQEFAKTWEESTPVAITDKIVPILFKKALSHG